MGAGRFVYIEDVEVLHRTEKAVQVRFAGETHWLPLSQIEDEGDNLKVGQSGYTVGITRFIADQRGIDATDD